MPVGMGLNSLMPYSYQEMLHFAGIKKLKNRESNTVIAIGQMQALNGLGWSYPPRTFKNVPSIQNQAIFFFFNLQQPDKGSYNGTTEFHEAIPNCVKEPKKCAHTVRYNMLHRVVHNFLF